MSTVVSPSRSHETPSDDISDPEIRRSTYEWLPVGVAGLVALVSCLYPVVRMFYDLQINYNEGWNVYVAADVTRHIPLYAQRYSWTTVNYPALSFYLISWLHRLGFGYLMTGRVLSLLSLMASALFVGLIVWKLSGNRRAAAFAAFFCLAIFCNVAAGYIGMDDPQILAQAFFLAGLLIYISGPPGWKRLGAVSLLFIIGGNIKHNLVGFPLAVLVDLFFVSRRKVMEYLAISGGFLGASIAGSMWADGPYFVSKILLPRAYSVHHAVLHFITGGFDLLQIPLVVAAVWSIAALRNTKLRVLSILFWLSLLVGVAFGGGAGVAVNTYFDLFLSVSMIIGLSLHWLWESKLTGLGVIGRAALPLVLLLSLAPSWIAVPHRTGIRGLPARQKQFRAEASFLASRPGGAICETLLLCYEAGKPYEFDPFNSFMLIRAGDLNERAFVEELERGEIGAVELRSPVSSYIAGSASQRQRFTATFAAAVANRYRLAFDQKGCYIYVPKNQPTP